MQKLNENDAEKFAQLIKHFIDAEKSPGIDAPPGNGFAAGGGRKPEAPAGGLSEGGLK